MPVIESKFGPIAVDAASRHSVRVHADDDFVIRGMRHRINAHVGRWEDGAWHVGWEAEPHAWKTYLGLKRTDRDWTHPTGTNATHAAQEQARDEIVRIVAEWAATPDGRRDLAEAEVVKRMNALDALNRQQGIAQNEVDRLAREMAGAEEELEIAWENATRAGMRAEEGDVRIAEATKIVGMLRDIRATEERQS